MDIEILLNNCMKDNEWSVGNSLLYDLCGRFPLHKNLEEVIAKIWLIGRSYACAIERRKIFNDSINDDFYITRVAPFIIQSDIDSWIQMAQHGNSVDVFLKTHKNLMDLFKRISGQDKRSLASKYLHFHLPFVFFIYDSRAVSALGKLVKRLGAGRSHYNRDRKEYDYDYCNFYEKCLNVREIIEKKFNETLTCRQFDNLLIEIANNDIRNH